MSLLLEIVTVLKIFKKRKKVRLNTILKILPLCNLDIQCNTTVLLQPCDCMQMIPNFVHSNIFLTGNHGQAEYITKRTWYLVNKEISCSQKSGSVLVDLSVI